MFWFVTCRARVPFKELKEALIKIGSQDVESGASAPSWSAIGRGGTGTHIRSSIIQQHSTLALLSKTSDSC